MRIWVWKRTIERLNRFVESHPNAAKNAPLELALELVEGMGHPKPERKKTDA
jgi:hypothetical protein